jgi:hypothetical protein
MTKSAASHLRQFIACSGLHCTSSPPRTGRRSFYHFIPLSLYDAFAGVLS